MNGPARRSLERGHSPSAPAVPIVAQSSSAPARPRVVQPPLPTPTRPCHLPAYLRVFHLYVYRPPMDLIPAHILHEICRTCCCHLWAYLSSPKSGSSSESRTRRSRSSAASATSCESGISVTLRRVESTGYPSTSVFRLSTRDALLTFPTQCVRGASTGIHRNGRRVWPWLPHPLTSFPGLPNPRSAESCRTRSRRMPSKERQSSELTHLMTVTPYSNSE